jgi:vacuolar-type H+-ATPase subunit C/Vma6
MTEKKAILKLDLTDYCIDIMNLIRERDPENTGTITPKLKRKLKKKHRQLVDEIDEKIKEVLKEYLKSRMGKSIPKQKKTETYL